MKIKFNVPGKKRKELAAEIAAWLGEDVQYAGAPTFAYRIGRFTVDRDGILSGENFMDEEAIERLLEHLYDEGFESDISAEENEPTGVAIQIPMADISETQLQNLFALTEAKGNLIKKAFGIDSLPINLIDDRLDFPWFSADSEPEELHAYMTFITKLCEMAKTQKRITAKEKEVENEKYAFRCFLLRLGFIGDEFKTDRKILLRNLNGSSAFKTAEKTFKVELDGDNFKVFTARNLDEAEGKGREIAESLGSEFCEVSEVNE